MAQKKKVVGLIKLQIPAGQAKPAPPVGPALGQRGLNIMEFCKAFNDKTKNMEQGMAIPVEITAYADKTFTFITKTPPATALIKKALGLKSGSKKPGTEVAGKISQEQIDEIAKIKMPDLNAHDIESAKKIIAGSALSMGLKVEGMVS